MKWRKAADGVWVAPEANLTIYDTTKRPPSGYDPAFTYNLYRDGDRFPTEVSWNLKMLKDWAADNLN